MEKIDNGTAGQRMKWGEQNPVALRIQQHGYESVVLVSHMPLVSYLVHELDASVQPPIFPTAGIAVVDFSPETLRGKFQQLLIAERCAG